MSAPKNPPAFPCEAQGNRDVPAEHDYIQTGIYTAKFPGMSLRDYFAAAALPQAMILAEAHPLTNMSNVTDCVVKIAYGVADAMLAARAPAEKVKGE